MRPFTTIEAKAAVLDRDNVDTDQIIPKQFLTRVLKSGYGEFLFYDWRYLNSTICRIDEQAGDFVFSRKDLNPEFELNAAESEGARVLLCGNNFGCGSSREHAVWALMDAGYRVVIAPRQGDIPAFADIFRNNAINNGLLPIELAENDFNALKQQVKETAATLSVSLEKQTITLNSAAPKVWTFEIAPSTKEKMIEGLDAVGITLRHQEAISAYEARMVNS